MREDPRRAGLLFGGSERHVYFSIDDGRLWHLLRQNLPPSSIRDLVIHGEDLVVGTHGRSIWILDNISPLRELAKAAGQAAYLFTPPLATRVRDNLFSDTPLSIEEPTGQNPPDGAILVYSLGSLVDQVVLEILDQEGDLVRRFSSDDPLEGADPASLAHPTYWIRPPVRPDRTRGHHRFVWDLRYPPPPGTDREFSIAATHRNTPSGPAGPFVHPGRYTVRLSARGVVIEKPLQIRMDPRGSATAADIRLQTDYSMRCYRAYLSLQQVREAIDSRLAGGGLPAALAGSLHKFRGAEMPGLSDLLYGSISRTPVEQESVIGLQRKLLFLLSLLQGADARPTLQSVDALERLEAGQRSLVERWRKMRETG